MFSFKWFYFRHHYTGICFGGLYSVEEITSKEEKEDCGVIRNLVGIRGDGPGGDMGEEARGWTRGRTRWARDGHDKVGRTGRGWHYLGHGSALARPSPLPPSLLPCFNFVGQVSLLSLETLLSSLRPHTGLFSLSARSARVQKTK